MSSSEDSGEMSPLKQALLAVRTMRARVQALEADRRAPIAIVGAGCRFPGGVVDLESLWTLLSEGVDAVGPVPADRWDRQAWYGGADPQPGKMRTTEGGFLDEIARFDADHFGIAPREALEMDPAQRMLLEVAWEALEDAGIRPSSLEGSATGVYVGLGLSDYSRRHFGGPHAERLTPYSGTGSFLSVASGRISYALGLQGPALTVDTACSSSLVALHLAVGALRSGEVEVALAGGANALIAPEPSVYFSQLQALAPDGRCKPFDARADGYGRGEGCGVVVLKRLDRAQQDGDRVLGVIRGTAVNQDGRSNGLTAPSGRAQQAVVRQALQDAGLEASAVGYIEAHGTGTPLGDPIEASALSAVFDGDRPVAVGSIKAHIAHTETAAGIAGVLSALAILEHGTVPGHPTLGALNPRLRLGGGLTVPSEAVALAGEAVGVSSFGLSGTNAHVVLTAGMPGGEGVYVADERPREPVVLPLSAASEAGLRALAGAWIPAVEAAQDLTALALRAGLDRDALGWREAVVGDRDAVVAALKELAGGGGAVSSVRGRPRVVFAFTGQGSQRPGMAAELHASEPVFAEAWDRVCALLDPLLGEPLTAVVFWEDERIHRTEWTQPALFALQVSLVELLGSWGVEADGVLGHSIGEVAAAWVAGVLSLEDAARLVAARATRMGALPEGGAMAAILTSEERVAAQIVGQSGVSLAAVNGPTEVVISGEADGVEAVAAAFEEEGVRVVRLTVSHAFHSARMEPMLAGFEEDLQALELQAPALNWFRAGGEGDPATAGWWRDQVRNPVRFAQALRAAGSKRTVFVELGPRPVLAGMGARVLEDSRWVGTLDRELGDVEAIRRSAGALFEAGIEPSWHAVLPQTGSAAPRLPRRPWVGERYWLEPAREGADALGGLARTVQWTQARLGAERSTGSWLVVGGGARGAALVEGLTARGHTARQVPADADVEPADRVIWFAEPPVETAGTRSSVSLCVRAHGWLTRSGERNDGTWWVTHRGTAHAPEVAAAAVWSLGRVAAQEQPGAFAGLVDLPSVEASVEGLLTAVLEGAERELRVVGDRVEGARLRHTLRARGPQRIPKDPSRRWLVTGGLGAVGLQVARWLVDQGVRSLTLVGRTGASTPERKAAVAALEARGAVVEVQAVDLAEPGAVTALIEARDDWGGVVHGAGVVDDGSLAGLTEADFARAIGPKLTAAEALADALAGVELEAFVLLGSASAVLGTVGQGAYAAANGAMAALAARLRSEGRAAVALELGPLAGAGMGAVAPEVAAGWAKAGVRTLDPHEALEALGWAATSTVGRVVLAPFDWPLVARHRPDGDALLADFQQAKAQAAAPVTSGTALVERLTAAPASARRSLLAQHVGATAAAVLGRTAGGGLPAGLGFFDAGLDSLMAVELRNRLQDAVGASLPATVAFDHPSVDALTDHLLGAVLDLADAPERAERAPTADPREPVALVGAGCRFPGADDLEAFWALLQGTDHAIGPVPDGRFDLEPLFHPDPATPGRTYAREAGYVRGLEEFDADLFGVSPREARVLDPQQRMLLETAWAALEDAAIPPESLRDRQVGVYVGIAASEYGRRFDPLDPTAEPDPYAGTGNESSFAPGRLAHHLGLRGPALAVNTACSSSLVALHLAVRALRSGECEVALVAGVNAIPGPDVTVQLSQIRALSPTSRCHTFDAAADGYVRGEGCGVVVLRRLTDAVVDGDPVRAVVSGTAVNHDGAAAGLTVPSGPAQQAVVRQALDDAGRKPEDVGLVECHGTGTSLGDPIEVGALKAVFGDREQPLALSAVKTRVGHLEAGAGLVGLLSAVFALENGVVPGVVGLESANPQLPLDGFPVSLSATAQSWEPSAVGRVAGVSSFGLSGTNAHAVLAQAPLVDTVGGRPLEARGSVSLTDGLTEAHVLALSAHTDAALRARAQGLRDWLSAHPEAEVADVVHTLAVGRSAMAVRAAGSASDRAGLVEWLESVAKAGGERAGTPRVGLLFTGQGSQSPGMAKALYDHVGAFRQVVDQVAAVVDGALEAPLKEVWFGDDPRIHHTAWTQPALYALQVGLATVLRGWGVQPAAVCGHSIGQLAAAVVAGLWTVEQGAAIAAARGREMGALAQEGGMLAVRGSEAAVLQAVEGLGLDLAAVNAPDAVVLSGGQAALAQATEALGPAGLETTPLETSHAFHSALMEPAIAPFEAVVAAQSAKPLTVPLVETLSGALAGDELALPSTWGRHLRGTVRFADALQTLSDHVDVLVELGPHPVLLGMAARTVDTPRVPTLRRKADDGEQLLATAGALFAAGVPVDLDVVSPTGGRRIHLPALPLQRERHWVDLPERAVANAAAPLQVVRWEALGVSREPAALTDVGVLGSGPVAEALMERLGARWLTLDDLEAPTSVVVDTRPLERTGGTAADGRILVAQALELAQQVAGSRSRVVWLTAGGSGAHGAPDPAQRALHGFVATAELEGLAGSVGFVDLDPQDPVGDGLIAALGRSEARLAVRGDTVLGPQLSEGRGGDRPVAGTWWVTGGLGAIGLAVAADLAARGAQALVLTGRSAPTEAAQAVVDDLADAGITVRVLLGDVSDPDAVSRLAAAIEAREGTLTGVVHAAGGLADGLIPGLSEVDLDRVWSGKVAGAEALAAACPEAELVFVSSVAGVLGSVGQGVYGAANAFLDALAERLRTRGRQATSVAFGPWASGMADAVSRDWEGQGIRPLPAARALAWLHAARGGTSPSVIAVDLDWPTWGATLSTQPAWLSDRLGAPDTETSSWATELAALDPTSRRDRLQAHIRGLTATVLGRTPDAIDPTQGFFDAGFDSLLAVELVERLQRDLGQRLPRTLVFEHGSVQALTTHLLKTQNPKPKTQNSTLNTQHSKPKTQHSPIAIIGMACRFPGADSPEAFWNLLVEGRSAVGRVPADRWDPDAAWGDGPTPPAMGFGAFLDEVDRFDAAFFGISPREAESLDPQQRLLLEVSQEALERTGAAHGLTGSRTGVFMGVAESDYLNRFRRAGDPFYGDTYAGSGNEGSFPAGRISYLLGLQGPAVSLNTACSSSLVATHLACGSLRLGECDLALAGGVSLMLAPDNQRYLVQLGALSPTGACHTFDASADGYVRGEGCGVLVLKRLDDALADGDRVLAVIPGSAVNHDGPSSGLTVPNGTAQQRVIREALAAGGVSPREVDVLEAHGTGTPLGDPIEVRAAQAVLGTDDREAPLILGSVKTNLGHLEQAAAMAGIVKGVLMLQHGKTPAHLGLETANPDLPLGEGLTVPAELSDWVRGDHPRTLGVSSFGISGTNGHLVLQEAPAPIPESAPTEARPVAAVPVWGHTPEALADEARQLARWWSAHPADPTEVAATRWLGRTPRPWRAMATGTDRDAVIRDLHRIADEGIRTRAGDPRWVFCFTGQGAQAEGMGQALYEAEPVFREVCDRVAAVVDPELPHGLLDAMFGRVPDVLHHTATTQPALFAYECAMAALWVSWGVRPTAVIGHSVGQLAAAVTAGVWSLEDGARLVARRGALMGGLPEGGSMVALQTPEESVSPLLEGLTGVGLAAVNGPSEVVISGDADAVDTVVDRAREAGLDPKGLKTSHAFHSHRMEPAVDAFREAVARAVLSEPQLALVENATGGFAGPEVATAAFWADAIRQPVRFAPGIQTLREAGYTHFLEMGNHPVLCALIAGQSDGAVTVASGHRKREPVAEVVGAVGRVWAHGTPVDARAFLGRGPAHLPLPTTAWQRQRFWIDAPEFPEQTRGPAVRSWFLADRPLGSGPLPDGTWAVLGTSDGFGATLVEALTAAGATASLATDGAVPDGADLVVDCRPLEATEADAERVAAEALRLLQGEGRRLWWVATGPVAELLAGFARVGAEEHKEATPTVVRVDAAPDHAEVLRALGCEPYEHVVLAERDPHSDNASQSPEPQLRSERLVPGEAPDGSPELDPMGAWLVTGGFGDLGAHTARWLVDRGVRHLWLVSRSGGGGAAEPLLAELRELGAEAHAAACDVADADALKALLTQIREDRPLRGVVHAAGVLHDALLADQTAETLAKVLGPKVAGARNLDALTADDPLEGFVLYSSAAVLVGLPGQATYAAANGFLDGLARRRRSEGRPGTSIQWGPWAGSSMVSSLDEGVLEHQRRLGIGHLEPTAALAHLGAALVREQPVVAVLSVDWTANRARYLGRSVPGLLREVVTSEPVAASTRSAPDAPVGSPDDVPALVALVRDEPKDRWPGLIEADLVRRVNGVLRAPADTERDREQPLWDMGMDSMMTVELRNLLIGGGVRLKVARMIGGPSISEVALMVVAELEQHPLLTAPEPKAPAADRPVGATDGEEPLDPVWSHVGAALGGGVVTAILGVVAWQIWTIVLGNG